MFDRTRISGWLVVLLATLGLSGTALAADDVRSAFILNLAKYVEWPAPSGVIEDVRWLSNSAAARCFASRKPIVSLTSAG